MPLLARTRLLCVIVDALQEAVVIDGQALVLPYSQRVLASRITDALTARHRAEAIDRAIDVLALDGLPSGATVPLRPSGETFSVLLVKVPMDPS